MKSGFIPMEKTPDVDALDHIGPVEHERLVALALQAAVVLTRQVELFEGRAHTAVEDDDPLPHGPQEITVRHWPGRVAG